MLRGSAVGLLTGDPDGVLFFQHQSRQRLVERHGLRGRFGNHQLGFEFAVIIDPEEAHHRSPRSRPQEFESRREQSLRVAAPQQLDAELIQQQQVAGMLGIVQRAGGEEFGIEFGNQGVLDDRLRDVQVADRAENRRFVAFVKGELGRAKPQVMPLGQDGVVDLLAVDEGAVAAAGIAHAPHAVLRRTMACTREQSGSVSMTMHSVPRPMRLSASPSSR